MISHRQHACPTSKPNTTRMCVCACAGGQNHLIPYRSASHVTSSKHHTHVCLGRSGRLPDVLICLTSFRWSASMPAR